jgi:hypothetical protein
MVRPDEVDHGVGGWVGADRLNPLEMPEGADPTQETQRMSAPRKYEQEFRDRAVRMYRERLAEPGESKRAKITRRVHVGLERHVLTLADSFADGLTA